MTAKPEWRRVSPVATVYFAVKTLQQLFDLWPVLIPALAGSERVRELLWQIGLPLGFIALLLGLVLQYWCFSYRTEPGRISLRSGVFKRKRLTLEFERVQQADISHPFYFRPFRLATLGLESAGSEWQEVDIPGIPVALAEALRRQVLEAGGDSAAQAGGGVRIRSRVCDQADTGRAGPLWPDAQRPVVSGSSGGPVGPAGGSDTRIGPRLRSAHPLV